MGRFTQRPPGVTQVSSESVVVAAPISTRNRAGALGYAGLWRFRGVGIAKGREERLNHNAHPTTNKMVPRCALIGSHAEAT